MCGKFERVERQRQIPAHVDPRRLLPVVGAFLVLVVVHTLTMSLERSAWEQVQSEKPTLRQEGVLESIAQGVIPGIAGGLQNLIVDFIWIRMSQSWANREVAETQALIHTATALDPRPFYFWRNGARIIAYDIPVWRIQSLPEAVGSPDPIVIESIRRDYAEKGIEMLLYAEQFHPENPEIWIEIGQIQNNLLRDRLAAALSFRKAYEMEGGPYFAGRLYAELLRRAGLPEEAYAFYREMHPELPEGEPMAAADVVLGRIRDLESELEIPAAHRYRPGED